MKHIVACILAIILFSLNCIIIHKNQNNAIGTIPGWQITDSISFDFKFTGCKILDYKRNSIALSRNNLYLFIAIIYDGRAEDISRAKHNWSGDTLHVESYMVSTMLTDMLVRDCVIDSVLINNENRIILATGHLFTPVEIKNVPWLPKAMVYNSDIIRKE
jgi:hypothetical protein